MSSYATLTDLARFGLPASALEGISTAAQQAALDASSDRADGYLGSQFTLPLLTWSTDVTQAVCAIAAYDLLTTRGYNPETGADVTVRDRQQDAFKWLQSVAAGQVHPRCTDSTPLRSGGGPSVTSKPQRGW